MFWPSMMSFAEPPVSADAEVAARRALHGLRLGGGRLAAPERLAASGRRRLGHAAWCRRRWSRAAALLSGAAALVAARPRRRRGRGPAVVVAATAGRQAEGGRHRGAAVQDLAPVEAPEVVLARIAHGLLVPPPSDRARARCGTSPAKGDDSPRPFRGQGRSASLRPWPPTTRRRRAAPTAPGASSRSTAPWPLLRAVATDARGRRDAGRAGRPSAASTAAPRGGCWRRSRTTGWSSARDGAYAVGLSAATHRRGLRGGRARAARAPGHRAPRDRSPARPRRSP